MSEGLQGRIMHEARRNKNALMTAYAGDLAEMIEELTARAERAEAELAEMTIERDTAQRALYDFEQSSEAQNVMRAQGMIDATLARAERAEDELVVLRAELDELKYAADAEYIMRARRGDY